MKSFSFVCEILVTVYLMFFVPIFYFTSQEEMLLESEVQYQTIYFTDCIRNIGFLSKDMYEEFEEKLRRTDHVYEIELTVYEKYENSNNPYGYWLGIFTEDIVQKLYEGEERYLMHRGNFIAVTIQRKDSNMVERILSHLGVLREGGIGLPFHYGGMVRDECV